MTQIAPEQQSRVLSVKDQRPDAPGTIDLLGVPIHAFTEAQCVAYILDRLESGIGGWVITHNLDHLRRLHRDATFQSLCNDASIRVADGAPLLWAGWMQGTPFPDRVAGSNLISSLSTQAAKRGRSIYLLGGAPHAAEGAAAVLQTRCPDLVVAGTHCPPHGFDRNQESVKWIEQQLQSAEPDIVYVALGSPRQEQLIAAIRHVLPNAWWIGVGISFSFLSGDVKRAPRWMQACGLEWAHRLAQEPNRLWRRYLIDGVPFAIRLLASCAARRMIGTARRM